jgi:predicted dehydrogenase
MNRLLLAGFAILAFLPLSRAEEPGKKVIRVGMIGLDTSHVIEFTRLLNGRKAEDGAPGVRVVAGYPGGSPDVEASRTRVAKFTQQLRDKYGLEIVDSIEALLPKVDAVLLMSVDGRPHLKQVLPVLKAHKPVFIDKPLAGSLPDVLLIFQLAKAYNVPCFSCSSIRFSPTIQNLRHNSKLGDVLGCDAWGHFHYEEHHPDLFWYGIHGVEALFTVMGNGCESVTRVHTEGTEFVTGLWKGGRVGTFRGIGSGKMDYGVVVFGSKAIVPADKASGGYPPHIEELVKFFTTGKTPVSADETIEIFAFMEAADESKRQGGVPVKLETVLAKARAEAERRKAEYAPKGVEVGR